MATLVEQQELREFNEVVDTWARSVRTALADAPVAQEEVLRRWAETVRRLSEAIDDAVPPSLHAEEVSEIRGDLLAITRSVLAYDSARPLDSYEETLLRLEAIRHVVRDAVDQPLAGEHDAGRLIADLEAALPRIGRRELAHLLGVSDRSIQRVIAAPEPVEPSRRLMLVALLVDQLRRGWTPEGAVAWFDRSRSELDGLTPLQALEDPAREQDVLALARTGRAQHGS